MTTTHAPLDGTRTLPIRGLAGARFACAAATIGTVVPFVLASLTGDSGAEITAGLEADVVSLTVAGIVAVLVSSALFLAAVRLGDRVGGGLGRLVTAAGAAVALMYAAYYATFAAGAVVAAEMLTDPGPGLGEATALLLNLTEIARYAPGLALVAAAVAARDALPKPVRIAAGVLVAMTVVPLTSWVAALLIPVWLGVSAAAVRS
jgi:hypothetical protein